MNEEMKEIPGYSGRYSITVDGRIMDNKRNKWLKLGLHRGGYTMATLDDGVKSRFRTVHRLVAITYIPNPNNYPYVCHREESHPSNNHVSNLFWGTPHMNSVDMSRKGRAKNNNTKLLDSQVLIIRQYPNTKQMKLALSYKFRVSTSTIHDVQTGRKFKHLYPSVLKPT
jgi:hypothetical protein